MPTGYTAPVKDGEITELEDFALTCARGFMPLVLLRDSEQGLDATRRMIENEAYLETHSYYEKEIESATERLAELEDMSDDEALQAARLAADEVESRNREIEQEGSESQDRYEQMIAKVEAWEPPTSDHENFKEFMLKQLRGSIDFDCHPFALAVPVVSVGWRDDQIAEQHRRLARAKEQIAEAESRNASRKAWVEALRESLEGVPA